MRIFYARTNNRNHYKEGGATSWGLGVDVVHYATVDYWPNDEEPTFEPEGVTVDVQVGPWMVSVMSEAAARFVYGESLVYMPKVGQG